MIFFLSPEEAPKKGVQLKQIIPVPNCHIRLVPIWLISHNEVYTEAHYKRERKARFSCLANSKLGKLIVVALAGTTAVLVC